MKKNIVLFILLFTSSVANAGFIKDQVPLKIYSNSAGVAKFGIINAPVNKTCNYFDRHFQMDVTTKAGEAMLKILISSKLSGKKINIWFTPSTTPGTTRTSGCVHESLARVTGIGISE